jgi:hypothetical protein
MERDITKRLLFVNPRTGVEFSCTDCRRVEKGKVPCDSGGLQACWYWKSHDASPGEAEEYGTQQALELYHQIAAYGWDLVSAFRTWRLSPQEGEALLCRVGWLREHLPAMLGEGDRP